MSLVRKTVLFLAFLSMTLASAAVTGPIDDAYALVDIMNAFLIFISCIFIFAILGTLRNPKLLALVKSAHFFKMKSIISAWTLLGSAILLFAFTEMISAFRILTDPTYIKLLRTLFGVLFATGLFQQYNVIMRYVKQKTGKSKKHPGKKKK